MPSHDITLPLPSVFLQRDSAAALMYAAASGHDPIVSLLLAGKSVVDQADKVRLFLD
jgi:ankyrin repeat protein